MNFTQDGKNPSKNLVGIGVVVLLHVALVYALVAGLARKVVDVIQQPVETKLIEEFKPPPPPPEKPVPPPPKTVAPPPPFVPPPEVKVQQPPQENVIAAVSNVKPENPVMPTTTAPTVPEAPPGPVHIAAKVDAKVGCEKPEYPKSALRDQEEGTVTLAFLIGVDGTVVDSKIEQTSGFKDLDRAARAGLSLCKFKPASTDGKPEQSWTKLQYVWRFE